MNKKQILKLMFDTYREARADPLTPYQNIEYVYFALLSAGVLRYEEQENPDEALGKTGGLAEPLGNSEHSKPEEPEEHVFAVKNQGGVAGSYNSFMRSETNPLKPQSPNPLDELKLYCEAVRETSTREQDLVIDQILSKIRSLRGE